LSKLKYNKRLWSRGKEVQTVGKEGVVEETEEGADERAGG
jgi:hypothetical protein